MLVRRVDCKSQSKGVAPPIGHQCSSPLVICDIYKQFWLIGDKAWSQYQVECTLPRTHHGMQGVMRVASILVNLARLASDHCGNDGYRERHDCQQSVA